MKQMHDKRWAVVKNRDSSVPADFFYAVKTTGIYCRPGCSSRLPNQENVEFFSTSGGAENAGYRPCKRCRPESSPIIEDQILLIAAVCRRILSSTSPLSLNELASGANMSPGHFHRLFKKVLGITPKEYSSSIQSDRFLKALDDGYSVTEAVYEAGYSSSGLAYDQLKSKMVMKPSLYRKGAPGTMIQYAIAECFLGWIVVANSSRGICAVLFSDDPAELPGMIRERFPKAVISESASGESVLLKEAVSGIGNPTDYSKLPLDIVGTAFQKRVWNALMEIPRGETASYGDIADRIGRPKAVRAVAGACAANKIAVYIPCHRIIRGDGGLGGYRWGLNRKKSILAKEQQG
jgi:AraC family transcriptional regulator of adaptative response/methylated-DNA-[protein]-cysteine methyltransferase